MIHRGWLYPALDIFVRSLPFVYRDVAAETGQSVRLQILGDAGGVWTLVRHAGGWRLFVGSDEDPAALISMDQLSAWKLFSKGLTDVTARQGIQIEGDRRLGEPVHGALAVMA